eukprot:1224785-Alexandrium_andersonii.AAC.1
MCIRDSLTRGGSEARWIDGDQKPLWCTSAAAMRTLAPRGSRAATAKGNMPATKEHFAVVTRAAWPSVPKDGGG